MIEYLKNYNLDDNDIDEIKKKFNKDIINKFEVMESTVISVFEYLKSIGITNIKNIIMYRPDICFSNIEFLKEKVSKIDSSLIKFIIEQDPQNLINLDI